MRAARAEALPELTGAFFDVDGTLTKSDIFRDLVMFRRAMHDDPFWHASWPLRGALLLGLDRFSRTAVNRVTYSWYRGLSPVRLDAWARAFQDTEGFARFRPHALALLRSHLILGHVVVLVTGALEEIVRPLPAMLARKLGEPLFERIVVEAARIEVKDGAFTGALDGPPLGGEEKARRIRANAERWNVDLARSFAYGDSIADAPMLEVVGRPAAVCPDARLRRLARRRGWPVLDLGKPA